jgi:hypothetical protein
MGGQSTAGQISTGITATKDIVYMNTNMINIQREDHTNAHGIESTFNQTRVLPIVGRTNRAEIAVKSIDVQTKALPIFQPQVQLGSNINRLIYEIGLSATWRNSMLKLPPDGSSLDTLIATNGDDDLNSSYFSESTFLNEPGAALNMIDSFNKTYPLQLIPTSVTHTTLSVLFDYWMDRIPTIPSNFFYETSLTPCIIPSVKQKILSTSYITSGPQLGQLVVEVSSVANFNVGDQCRLFGITDVLTQDLGVPSLFGTVTETVNIDNQASSLITGTHSAVVLNYPFVVEETRFPFAINTFPAQDQIVFSMDTGVGSSFTTGQNIIIQGAGIDPRLQGLSLKIDSISGDTIYCNCSFTNPQPSPAIVYLTNIREFGTGYIINETVTNGGHIELLTDEMEFRPIQFEGTGQNSLGTLRLEFSTALSPTVYENRGFFRGYKTVGGDLKPLLCPVEITVTQGLLGQRDIYNGYYYIVYREGLNVNNIFELLPIGKVLPFSNISLAGSFFTMKLAPNFYSMDTSIDELLTTTNPNPDVLTSLKRYNFIRSLGYSPTNTFISGTPTYPPTATIPSRTWSRAYTVNWDFSAYRNLEWVPQDTTATEPSFPLVQQDFGVDSSSTYYNVYELNKFFSDCVNKGLENCINDQNYEILNLEAISLNGQLITAWSLYKQLFEQPASTFLWNSTTPYGVSALVVSGSTSSSFVFISIKPSLNQPLPTTPTSTPSWKFLGYVPYQTGDPTPYALCIKQTYAWLESSRHMTATVENGVPGTIYRPISLYVAFNNDQYPGIEPVTQVIPPPYFKTIAPSFYYQQLELLTHCRFDGNGFGTVNVLQQNFTQSEVALFNYKRRSWGYQGPQNADEWFTLESNSSFKFLLDNFPSYCIAYSDTLAELRTGVTFPQIEYWIWDNSDATLDPRVGTGFYEISQSSESLSSCMSPVQSIVVVSENIPVVDELSSPAYYLVDSDSSTFANQAQTISLTEKIIGEIFLQSTAPYNSRSVIHYEEDNYKFVSLLDTRLFKQLEYSLYYRHRITQKLVPLILSNYGSVNIKFVFRPIS